MAAAARPVAGTTADLTFPVYTGAELAADRAVHLIGLPAAIAATAWLVVRAATAPAGIDAARVAALLVYGLGLVGMLSASAAYNLARPGRTKALLRRLDHAMIFVMIAGTYTPFALLGALGPRLGVALCSAVWALAAVGAGLKLACPCRVERASLALYLGLGWLVLVVVRPLAAALPDGALALLLAGGVSYSLGAFIHVWGGGGVGRRRRVPFHNAVWHVMVLAAAGLHLAAVARLVPPLARAAMAAA